MEHGSVGEYRVGEPRRHHNGVVLGWLISRHEERVGLSKMNIERRVCGLHGV
jgi:hypothetical protein